MLLRWLLLLVTIYQVLARDSWKNPPGCQIKGNTRQFNIDGCMPINVTTNGCRGYCQSWSLPSIILGYKRHPVTSYGQCCNIVDTEDVYVKALCLEGEREILFKSAVSCGCYYCQKE